MPLREFVLRGRSCNNLARLFLPYQRFLDNLESLVAHATLIEIDYGTSLLDARNTENAQDLFVSNLIRRVLLASCMRQERITNLVLHNPMS